MFFLKWLFDRTPDEPTLPREPEGGLPPLQLEERRKGTNHQPDPVDALRVQVTVSQPRNTPVARIASFQTTAGRRADHWRQDVPLHDTTLTIIYRTHGKDPRPRPVTLHFARNHMGGIHLHATCLETGGAREFRLHNTLAIIAPDGTRHEPRAFLKDAFGIEIEDVQP